MHPSDQRVCMVCLLVSVLSSEIWGAQRTTKCKSIKAWSWVSWRSGSIDVIIFGEWAIPLSIFKAFVNLRSTGMTVVFETDLWQSSSHLTKSKKLFYSNVEVEFLCYGWGGCVVWGYLVSTEIKLKLWSYILVKLRGYWTKPESWLNITPIKYPCAEDILNQ